VSACAFVLSASARVLSKNTLLFTEEKKNYPQCFTTILKQQYQYHPDFDSVSKSPACV
jgi:hypothetical protein